MKDIELINQYDGHVLILFQFYYHLQFIITSYLLSLYTGLDGQVMFTFWVFSGNAMYWVHRLGHNSKLKTWYNIHTVGHHLKCYPKTNFISFLYYKVNKLDSWLFGTLVYIIPILLLLGIWNWIYELNILQTFHLFIIPISALITEEGTHRSIHVSNETLDRITNQKLIATIYRELKKAHYKHHVYYNCNFGVVNLSYDFFYKTFK